MDHHSASFQKGEEEEEKEEKNLTIPPFSRLLPYFSVHGNVSSPSSSSSSSRWCLNLSRFHQVLLFRPLCELWRLFAATWLLHSRLYNVVAIQCYTLLLLLLLLSPCTTTTTTTTTRRYGKEITIEQITKTVNVFERPLLRRVLTHSFIIAAQHHPSRPSVSAAVIIRTRIENKKKKPTAVVS